MARCRRPSRTTLEALIRRTGGSMTALAAALGVSRTTTYSWVYQLGLDRLVGIREGDVREEKQAVQPTGRVPVTVKLDPALWGAARIRAIEEGRTASDVVEDAVRAYLAPERAEQPDAARSEGTSRGRPFTPSRPGRDLART